jgi:hypothetical protein
MNDRLIVFRLRYLPRVVASGPEPTLPVKSDAASQHSPERPFMQVAAFSEGEGRQIGTKLPAQP